MVEALRALVPATALYVAQGIDIDERITEIARTAGDRGIPILEVGRNELDRMTGGVLHQGVGLQVPPFAYEDFDDLVAAALEQTTPLLVALDGVTDPRNVGAVIRSSMSMPCATYSAVAGTSARNASTVSASRVFLMPCGPYCSNSAASSVWCSWGSKKCRTPSSCARSNSRAIGSTIPAMRGDASPPS